jgi:hypothetical protein
MAPKGKEETMLNILSLFFGLGIIGLGYWLSRDSKITEAEYHRKHGIPVFQSNKIIQYLKGKWEREHIQGEYLPISYEDERGSRIERVYIVR